MPEIAVRNTPGAAATEWLRFLPPATRFMFYGDARARALAAAVWPAPFVEQALRAGTLGACASLWLGPDEYLLLDADAAPAESIAQGLAAALGDAPHALVDISHRQTALELRGPRAAAILNGGCPLDFDIEAFPVGMCTRTVFAKAEIVLWRTAPHSFHVEVWRSFTDYVTALLSLIARDYYSQP
jgi:sarcosine oxidase subunit gamma